MKVRELVSLLEATDPDAPVTTWIDGYNVAITGVFHSSADSTVDLSHDHPED